MRYLLRALGLTLVLLTAGSALAQSITTNGPCPANPGIAGIAVNPGATFCWRTDTRILHIWDGAVWQPLLSVDVAGNVSVQNFTVTLNNATLNGTTTNNGTISGGTVSGATLAAGTTLTNGTVSGGSFLGTITNGGTISGGTYSSPTLTTPVLTNATCNGPQCDHGEVRLVFTNATTLTVQPQNGNNLIVKTSGVFQSRIIAAAGVTCGTGGLAVSTTYFVYIFDSAGTLTCELSTTTYATESTTGIKIKTADDTRTLVGMARTNGATQFSDSVTSRFVLSWFNRQPRQTDNVFTANRTTTSATYVEVNTEIEVNTLVWADDIVEIVLTGSHANGTAGQRTTTAIGIDGVATILASTELDSGVNGARHNAGVAFRHAPAEGFHFYTLAGKTTAASTGTWTGAADDTTGRCHLGTRVNG